MAANNEAIMEEVEALEAIMMDEVNVQHDDDGVPNGVSVTVVPATGQNIEEQHVKVTLQVLLPAGYPDVQPIVNLRNPRGIDDEVLRKMNQDILKKCEEYLGFPVIYELIEAVRENLTANNTPSCPCAICLFHFTDNDHFTKTQCFHYFHSYCLGRYVANCETEAAEDEVDPQPAWMAKEKKSLLCPVCREVITERLNSEELLACSPSEEEENLVDISLSDPDLVALQHKMASLYLHQQAQGGIINLEEEKNKFLVSSIPNDTRESEESDEAKVLVAEAVNGPSNEPRESHQAKKSNSNAPRGGSRGRGYHNSKDNNVGGNRGKSKARGYNRQGTSNAAYGKIIGGQDYAPVKSQRYYSYSAMNDDKKDAASERKPNEYYNDRGYKEYYGGGGGRRGGRGGSRGRHGGYRGGRGRGRAPSSASTPLASHSQDETAS